MRHGRAICGRLCQNKCLLARAEPPSPGLGPTQECKQTVHGLQVRPTADRGPILLCVDTSGSMRGAREIVAKALALECMRAAREQERGCYVFAFAGPREVGPTCTCRLQTPAA